MSYVELLRARNIFRIFGSVLTAIVVFAVASILFGTHFGTSVHHHVVTNTNGHAFHINQEGSSALEVSGGSDDSLMRVPLEYLFGIAAYAAIIFATILGPSLNKENDGYGYAFTKPVSRERLALEYFGVDLAAIVAVFAYTLGLLLLAIWCLGFFFKGQVTFDAGAALGISASGLGAAFMWYGLLQALTSWNHARGGLVIGLSWVYVTVLAPIATALDFGPGFHAVALAMNYINPLAYYASITEKGHEAVVESLLGFSTGADIALTWSIGIVACAVAAYGWKRLEV